MITSRDRQKALTHDKNTNRWRIKGKFLSLTNDIWEKPIARTTLNDEQLKAFFLSSGISQGCQLSPPKFNILLEVLSNIKTILKEIKANLNKQKTSYVLGLK